MSEKYNLEEEFRKEVLKSLDKKVSKEELKKIEQEAKESVEFLQKIEEVKLPSDSYVIFTDGDTQLYYENGEFYEISTTDSTKKKKKKSKKEATDMYLDFFIKYQLNPILDLKDKLNNREKVKENVVKEPKVKAKVKNNEPKEKEKEEKVVEKTQQIVKDDLEI